MCAGGSSATPDVAAWEPMKAAVLRAAVLGSGQTMKQDKQGWGACSTVHKVWFLIIKSFSQQGIPKWVGHYFSGTDPWEEGPKGFQGGDLGIVVDHVLLYLFQVVAFSSYEIAKSRALNLITERLKEEPLNRRKRRLWACKGLILGGGSKEFPQSWCQWIKPGELAKKKPTQPNSCATPPPVQSAHPLGAITWEGASSLQCKSLWKYKFYTMNQQQSFTCG